MRSSVGVGAGSHCAPTAPILRLSAVAQARR